MRLFQKKSDKVPTETATIVQEVRGSRGLPIINGNYHTQISEGLASNPYVYRCADLRSATVASLDPILFDEDGNEIEDKNHPLYRLLSAPSDGVTWRKFVFELEKDFTISGNAYIYPVRTVRGVEALYRVSPGDITPIPSGNPLSPIRQWQLNLGTGGVLFLKPNEIIHLYSVLDSDGIRGISPLEASAQSIIAQTEARKWNANLMKNGAKPSMIVKDPNAMPPTVFQSFMSKMRMAFSGPEKAGSLMVLDGGKDVDFAGFSARDMDFSAGITMTGREISIALGVPPELVGDSANKTYANASEANREFAIHTIEPLAKDLYDALTLCLCGDYDDVTRIGYDATQIEGMKGDMASLMTALTASDFLTVNEKRASLSYSAVDGGDEILMPMGKVPMSEILSDPLSVMHDNRSDDVGHGADE